MSAAVIRPSSTGPASYLVSNEPTRWNPDGLDHLLKHAVELGVSDVYIKARQPVMGRLHGSLVRLSRRSLDLGEAQEFVNFVYRSQTGSSELARLDNEGLDGAHRIEIGRQQYLRFRWTACQTLADGTPAPRMTLRQLPAQIPTLDAESLGPELMANLFPHDGLVLICGPTGSGKTTLLAGIVQHMAADGEGHNHILTYEAPIEFDFARLPAPATVIDQHEIPADFPNFAAGIRSAMRSDPDVIIVGEMRDPETINSAFVAAQTGHAVYSTMHTTSIAEIFSRPLLVFPAAERAGALGSLCGAIRVAIVQELVPSVDGRRVAIREALVFTDSMRAELLSLMGASPEATIPGRVRSWVKERGTTRLSMLNAHLEAGRISPSVHAAYAARYLEDAR